MWVMQESLSLAEKQENGADLGLRYQLNDYLYFDADANYTYARSIDEPNGQNHSSCTRFHVYWWIKFSKMEWTFREVKIYRYLKNRPAMKIIQL
jgi:hypothetical protein